MGTRSATLSRRSWGSGASISDGAAVAEGMRFAVRLGVEIAGCSSEFVQAQDDLLMNLGFLLCRGQRLPPTCSPP